MEVGRAPAAAKRMWSYLRAVFLMARKGKRKLLLGIHLLMKRRNKAIARTVANLLSHHQHHGGHGGYYHGNGNALQRRDYEFSCSNSPADPGSFSSRRRHAYFRSCLGAVAEEDEFPVASPLARIEYYAAAAAASPAPSSPLMMRELARGEEEEEEDMANTVRVSNFSSEDEEEGAGGSDAVDDEAEEFIRRFYEQQRRQNHVALLPYSLPESAA